MKSALRLEELFIAGLAFYLFLALGFVWWWFPLLLLVPDVSMIGYLANPRLGALTYNVVHHRGLGVACYIAGGVIRQPWLQAAGLVLLAHSSIDRVMGYGLKHADSFQHTHLGEIRQRRAVMKTTTSALLVILALGSPVAAQVRDSGTTSASGIKRQVLSDERSAQVARVSPCRPGTSARRSLFRDRPSICSQISAPRRWSS
jgi:hypothetical protein